MSCDGILLKGPDGKELCIPIYVEEVRLTKRPPNGDPLRGIWEDITVLATLARAVVQVNDERIRGQLSQVVQESIKTIGKQLPTGMSLGDGLMKVSSEQRKAM